MDEELKLDKLDAEISDIIARGESSSTGDEELDAFGRLAAGLRGLPSHEFRARLREEFVQGAVGKTTQSHYGRTNSPPRLGSWLTGQRPFLAAGSSFGFAAGACCLSGFAANVLGIASAGAVRAFISGALPYFVALSLVGLVGWILWFLREQGLSVTNVTGLVRQHGLAIAGSYSAVFAASMALANARGIY